MCLKVQSDLYESTVCARRNDPHYKVTYIKGTNSKKHNQFFSFALLISKKVKKENPNFGKKNYKIDL